MPTRRRFQREAEGTSVRDIVGGAHVVLGAIGLVGLVVAFMFAGSITASLPGLIVLAITQGATVLGGLWLRDGRRRGAILASVMGLLRVVVLVVSGSFGVDLVLTVILLVGVGYVWPTLTVDGE